MPESPPVSPRSQPPPAAADEVLESTTPGPITTTEDLEAEFVFKSIEAAKNRLRQEYAQDEDLRIFEQEAELEELRERERKFSVILAKSALASKQKQSTIQELTAELDKTRKESAAQVEAVQAEALQTASVPLEQLNAAESEVERLQGEVERVTGQRDMIREALGVTASDVHQVAFASWSDMNEEEAIREKLEAGTIEKRWNPIEVVRKTPGAHIPSNPLSALHAMAGGPGQGSAVAQMGREIKELQEKLRGSEAEAVLLTAKNQLQDNIIQDLQTRRQSERNSKGPSQAFKAVDVTEIEGIKSVVNKWSGIMVAKDKENAALKRQVSGLKAEVTAARRDYRRRIKDEDKAGHRDSTSTARPPTVRRSTGTTETSLGSSQRSQPASAMSTAFPGLSRGTKLTDEIEGEWSDLSLEDDKEETGGALISLSDENQSLKETAAILKHEKTRLQDHIKALQDQYLAERRERLGDTAVDEEGRDKLVQIEEGISARYGPGSAEAGKPIECNIPVHCNDPLHIGLVEEYSKAMAELEAAESKLDEFHSDKNPSRAKEQLASLRNKLVDLDRTLEQRGIQMGPFGFSEVDLAKADYDQALLDTYWKLKQQDDRLQMYATGEHGAVTRAREAFLQIEKERTLLQMETDQLRTQKSDLQRRLAEVERGQIRKEWPRVTWDAEEELLTAHHELRKKKADLEMRETEIQNLKQELYTILRDSSRSLVVAGIKPTSGDGAQERGQRDESTTTTLVDPDIPEEGIDIVRQELSSLKDTMAALQMELDSERKAKTDAFSQHDRAVIDCGNATGELKAALKELGSVKTALSDCKLQLNADAERTKFAVAKRVDEILATGGCIAPGGRAAEALGQLGERISSLRAVMSVTAELALTIPVQGKEESWRAQVAEAVSNLDEKLHEVCATAQTVELAGFNSSPDERLKEALTTNANLHNQLLALQDATADTIAEKEREIDRLAKELVEIKKEADRAIKRRFDRTETVEAKAAADRAALRDMQVGLATVTRERDSLRSMRDAMGQVMRQLQKDHAKAVKELREVKDRADQALREEEERTQAAVKGVRRLRLLVFGEKRATEEESMGIPLPPSARLSPPSVEIARSTFVGGDRGLALQVQATRKEPTGAHSELSLSPKAEGSQKLKGAYKQEFYLLRQLVTTFSRMVQSANVHIVASSRVDAAASLRTDQLALVDELHALKLRAQAVGVAYADLVESVASAGEIAMIRINENQELRDGWAQTQADLQHEFELHAATWRDIKNCKRLLGTAREMLVNVQTALAAEAGGEQQMTILSEKARRTTAEERADSAEASLQLVWESLVAAQGRIEDDKGEREDLIRQLRSARTKLQRLQSHSSKHEVGDSATTATTATKTMVDLSPEDEQSIFCRCRCHWGDVSLHVSPRGLVRNLVAGWVALRDVQVGLLLVAAYPFRLAAFEVRKALSSSTKARKPVFPRSHVDGPAVFYLCLQAVIILSLVATAGAEAERSLWLRANPSLRAAYTLDLQRMEQRRPWWWHVAGVDPRPLLMTWSGGLAQALAVWVLEVVGLMLGVFVLEKGWLWWQS